MTPRLAPPHGFAARWAQLAPRERAATLAAAVAVAGLVLWLVALQPALRTLRGAPEQHRALDAQLQSMRELASQAQGIQSAPPLALPDAVSALQRAAQTALGAAGELRVTGDQATVAFRAATPQQLAQFLPLARTNARAMPQQINIRRSATAQGLAWDGNMQMVIHAR